MVNVQQFDEPWAGCAFGKGRIIQSRRENAWVAELPQLLYQTVQVLGWSSAMRNAHGRQSLRRSLNCVDFGEGVKSELGATLNESGQFEHSLTVLGQALHVSVSSNGRNGDAASGAGENGESFEDSLLFHCHTRRPTRPMNRVLLRPSRVARRMTKRRNVESAAEIRARNSG